VERTGIKKHTKKGAVQDLLICNRNIAYIIKNNQVIVIAGYVIVN
jgi:hypothetical protein